MGENLVIVESPAKAKTIEKFLGKEYTVKSSFGHICDLAKKNLGIDIENGFEPKYEVSADKKKVVSELKALAKKAQTVWLASDEDREGEAIAWHLQNNLGLKDENTKRIVFHEITKSAILDAIKNPRKVDIDLVMAQQARRVLDRLVGFELSPILWKKVAPKLSAGRVQSVAVKLIVDREREIQAFTADTFYKVTGAFHPATLDSKIKLDATLDSKFNSSAEAEAFLNKCNGCNFIVEGTEKKKISRTPAPPFTTSALQQEAGRKCGFSVAQTMRIAQKLYESGLITYMRTDSTNLSTLALTTIKQAITENYGAQYSKTRQYKTKSKGAQEAHEAIRPTYASNIIIEGTAQEKKLYSLIWKRAVASQMADAELEKTVITIGGDKISEKFTSEGEQILFDGFLKLYLEGKDDEQDDKSENQLIPNIPDRESMDAIEISATQRFTQKPPRYSEASLVKKMEELEIGRPSTYAPTITTIMARGYIVKEERDGVERNYEKMTLSGGKVEKTTLTEKTGAEKNKLFPEDIGILVTDFLEKNFTSIMDYGFTAKIEDDFDKVAAGKLVWNNLIKSFYGPFHKKVEASIEEKGHVNAQRSLGKDPATGKEIIVRLGKFGPLVQKGDNDDAKKEFSSLRKGQSIETLTLEEALKLFDLPRAVGKWKDKAITAAIGRFGPYIKYDNKFVSLGKLYDPYTITEDEACTLIADHIQKEANKVIRVFEKEDIQVLNGRFGPYIKCGKDNYKIPKGKNAKKAEELTLEDCQNIIKNSEPTGKKRGKK
ncbi:MAG TPA: type I DNA topoisomerase [Candidatus Egerieousia sp.]|nr:type I DNA topoisomerase [Candidatus Egerieousia sp.]HPT05770.1 type I DNA topoisomerase [Candidatus Egerieousia sp.]